MLSSNPNRPTETGFGRKIGTAIPPVAVWLSGNGLVSINVVALRRVRLVQPTGMGDRSRVDYTVLIFNKATQVYSAYPLSLIHI